MTRVRVLTRVWVVSLVLAASVLGGCGDQDGTAAPAVAGSTPATTATRPVEPSTGGPGSPSVTPSSSGQPAAAVLQALRACQRETSALTSATVDYAQRITMKVGQTTAVSLRVLPAGSTPEPTGSTTPSVTPFLVSCQIEASIRPDAALFDVNPGNAVKKTFLPGQPTEWLWTVTPKKPGDWLLVFDITPVLLDKDPTGALHPTGWTTLSFTSTVHVRNSAGSAGGTLLSLVTWLTDLTNAAAALLAALAALLSGYLLLRRRRSRSSTDPGPADRDADDPGQTTSADPVAERGRPVA